MEEGKGGGGEGEERIVRGSVERFYIQNQSLSPKWKECSIRKGTMVT